MLMWILYPQDHPRTSDGEMGSLSESPHWHLLSLQESPHKISIFLSFVMLEWNQKELVVSGSPVSSENPVICLPPSKIHFDMCIKGSGTVLGNVWGINIDHNCLHWPIQWYYDPISGFGC